MTALALERVSVSLGGARVVNSLSCTVAPGEWVALIAWQCGGLDAQAIWDHPNNADIKQRRGDPNILAPGDRCLAWIGSIARAMTVKLGSSRVSTRSGLRRTMIDGNRCSQMTM